MNDTASRRRFLSLLSAAAVPSSLSSARAADSVGDISAALEKIRAEHDVPSLTALFFTADKVVARGASGWRLKGSPPKVTVEDKYHIGSITKSFTSVLAGQLVEQGKIKWETTLAEALPGMKMLPEVGKVTLHQLLHHRSGLQRDIPDDLWATLKGCPDEPMKQRQRLAGTLLLRKPAHTAGEHYEYSNAGYTLAGLMLETRLGKPWEKVIAERVFQPLGLKSAGFGAPAKSPSAVDQPWGHKSDGDPVRPGPLADNMPAIGPAGTIHMTLGDLARYCQWHLHESGPLKPAIVTPATLQLLHGAGNPDGYQFGWERLERPWAGGQAIMHTGSNTMFFAVAWLAPARGFGMVAGCNQGGDAAAKACDAAAAQLIQQFSAAA